MKLFWDETHGVGEGILWDASDWYQVNPVVTDADGRYQWDVPEGWWQVRFTKEGYENAESSWMCVAPPQTEVNIPMISLEAPSWTLISVHKDHLTLLASRYLKPETIVSLELLDATGEAISFTAEWPTDETAQDGTVYARMFRLNYSGRKLEKDEEITLVVPENTVKSYAGVSMAGLKTTVVYKGEKRIIAPQMLSVMTGSQLELKVRVENFEPMDVLNAVSELTNTVQVISVSKLDTDGTATVILKGGFKGTGTVTLTLNGTDISVDIAVSVVDGQKDEHDGFTVTVNREDNTIADCTIVSNGGATIPAIIVAAAYGNSGMTHVSVRESEIDPVAPFVWDLDWTGLETPTQVKIMLWSPETLAPIAAPFVF